MWLAVFWQEVIGYVPLDPGDGGAVAVDRLVALGGRVLWTLDGSTVLADPDGNEFCIFS